MKSFFLAIVLSILTMSAISAAETPSVFVYGTLKNNYILGNGVVASDRPVFQTGITFSWKSGLYADIWGSKSLVSSSPSTDYGNETDLTAGWRGSVGNFRLDAGVAHFNVSPVSKINNEDFWDVFVEATPTEGWKFGRNIVTPFVRLEAINSSGRDIDWAKQLDIGLRHNVPIDETKNLNQEVRVRFAESFPGTGGGTILSYKGAVDLKVSKSVTVSPFYERRQPLGLDAGRVPQNIFGVGFGIAF